MCTKDTCQNTPLRLLPLHLFRPQAIRGSKRKSMADSIADVSAHEQANHIKIVNINANAKNCRSDQRESCKWHTSWTSNLLTPAPAWWGCSPAYPWSPYVWQASCAWVDRADHGSGASISYGGQEVPPGLNGHPSIAVMSGWHSRILVVINPLRFHY